MKPSNNGSSFVPPTEEGAHKLTNQRPCSCHSTDENVFRCESTNESLYPCEPIIENLSSCESTNGDQSNFESTNQIRSRCASTNGDQSHFESTNQMPSCWESTNGNPSAFNSTNHTVPDSLWHQVMSHCFSAMMNVEKIFFGSIFSDIDNILANHANINIGEMDFHPQNDTIK